MTAAVVGVDIGGSGIKGAPVDLERGVLAAPRVRVETPQPATPEAVIAAVVELVAGLDADGKAAGGVGGGMRKAAGGVGGGMRKAAGGVGGGMSPVGVGLPSPIVDGTAMMAANIDPGWVGVNAERVLGAALGRPCWVLNDADAAGLAEMRFGAGAGVDGVVLVLTLGTGIGSALFVDGRLVPNTELGHIEVRGRDAEERAAASVRERKGLSYARWAKRLDEYLHRVDRLVWPDLVILGGGVSKRADRFLHHLTARPPVVAARLRNEAGIVGAALRAGALSGNGAPECRPLSARG